MARDMHRPSWLAVVALALLVSPAVAQHEQCAGAADGSPCDDGNACTTRDACRAGACAGERVSCDDGNACNGVESCDPARGCRGGETLTCNDGDPCTLDLCELRVGCRARPLPGFAACRARRVVQFIADAQPSDFGGLRRRRRLLQRATAAARRLERAADAPRAQAKRQLHRRAKRDLLVVNRRGRRGLARGYIQPRLANELLALVGQAARAA